MTSRDIKVRFWINELKEMFKAERIEYLAGELYSLDLYDEKNKPIHIYGVESIKKRVVAEQYTGTDDKNGVPIYENDILRQDILGRGYYYYVVEWYRGCFFLSRVGGSSRKAMFLEYEEDYNTEFEVIGNIHEDKGLLEV
ncbi:YopX family protein [Weissella tructae]